ncbi:hypothetical protein AMS68_003236 [Peltaster fructicola]|uniref:RAVE complex protein Rav1 C-terminal domain-containing protein n=1 Tax=Peltaster fructicola TaxID=286661 RepID=A0A6H0XSX3_9PEZI|nr:hypothetical protein AMS68_003236 [Peltaster fructicola]
MPSLSPGGDEPTVFEQILPGAPNAGFQSITTFTFRWKRYILYISGHQLNVLRSPNELDQAITFEEELVAIRAEGEDTGRVAVASANNVWTLKPSTSSWNRVGWVKELSLANANNEVRSLSWGTEGELLVAGTRQLALFGTLPSSRATSPATLSVNISAIERRAAQWTKPIACPLRFVAFSPSCGLITTAGDTDRQVKVWRRLSFEEAIFDFAYLPHDGIVTHLDWRPAEKEKLEQNTDNSSIRSHHGDENREVLYTISADGNLRVWRTNSHNDLDILSLYSIVDLVSAIPHSPVLTMNKGSTRPARYAFIIPSGTYSTAVAAALRKHPQQQVKHGVEHLKEVVSRDPDVIVALDTQGRMSAWGLSSIGHKRRSASGLEMATAPFHIAHSESLGLTCDPGIPTAFESWVDGDVLNILAHSFGRSVKWWRGTVENFSSSSALASDRGQQVAAWVGSTGQYMGLRTAVDGRLISWTSNGSAMEWAGAGHQIHTSLHVDGQSPSVDVDSVQRHKSLLLLGQKDITLARVLDGKGVISRPHLISDGNLSLLRMHAALGADERYMVYSSAGRYTSVLVNPTRSEWSSKEPTIELTATNRASLLGTDLDIALPAIVQFSAVLHPRKADWLRIVGVDANGTIYRRDVACAALVNVGTSMLESTLAFATGIKAGRMSITSSSAVVLSPDGYDLVIIDLKEGYVEHKQTLASRAQQIVCPYSTEDEVALTQHSLLAVVSDTSVDILARSRYDHNQSGHWATVKHISLGDIGLVISSATWLGNGKLVLAAGSSIFISDDKIARKSLSNKHCQQLDLTSDVHSSMDELVSMLRGPLTCWQPHVLRELILHGHFGGVITILSELQAKLKFYTNGDELDALLDLNIDQLLTDTTLTYHEEIDFSELSDQLDELDLPFTSDDDQGKLKLVVHTVSFVARYQQSLDLNAIRYLSYWRYHVLLELHQTPNGQANGSVAGDDAANSSTHKALPTMAWREINFAYHSTTQQPLLDVLVQYYENKLDWPTVRALGITLWLHTIKAAQSESHSMASVEQVFEAVGQSAYRSTQPPNPADASLFLLALRKKAVLLSLWRVAVGNREQKSTQNFLRRDFDAEENKTAARKNAYALMGKRRFEYAAAFFLLADDAISAISILAGQCEDLHLAVSVARAYCGDGSPVLQNFMRERVVPIAQNTTNRWLLAWSYAIMEQRPESLRALIVDAGRLSKNATERLPRSWQQDDPAALTFYRELRDTAKSKSTLRKTTLDDEYRAVLRSARILRRRGFWLLSLRLVQHWSFMQPVSDAAPATELSGSTSSKTNAVSSLLESYEESKPGKPVQKPVAVPSMLDAFDSDAKSTPTIEPQLVDEASQRAAKAAALLAKIRSKNATANNDVSQTNGANAQEKKPTQFNEPASSSILDSFGF